MQNTARKLSRETPTLEEATVVEARGATLRVRAGDVECEAARAASCLVAPEPGDEVLVGFASAGRCFVLAVLVRAEPGSATRVSVDGDLDLQIQGGRFGLKAARGIALTSGDDLSLASRALSVSALEGSVFIQKLAYVGSRLRAEVEAIKAVGSVCDSLYERVSQRVKRSIRHVEDIDQVRAKKIDYAAETTMALGAENAVVRAEEIVKVDASQIQLG